MQQILPLLESASLKSGNVARVGNPSFFWWWLEDGDFDGEVDEADDVGEDARNIERVGESLWGVDDDDAGTTDDVLTSDAPGNAGLSFKRLRYSSRLT